MTDKPRPIGLREVAAAAGVSLGTASQALRGTGTTGRQTAERIRKLAAEMGYRPDPLMAAAGARHRAGVKGAATVPVGFLCAQPREHRDRFPSVRFEKECEEILRQEGFEVSTANAGTPDELRRIMREWYHRGLRGVLLSHFWHPEWIGDCDWSAFSVLHLGGRFETPTFHTVRFSAAQGLDRCLREALARPGRVGVILHHHGEQRVMDDLIREGVFADWRRRHPDRVAPVLRLAFEADRSKNVAACAKWLKKEKPQVLCGFPVARILLEEAGALPAPDLSFFQYAGGTLPPGMAGMVEAPRRLIITAATQLEDMIRRHETGIPEAPLLISVPPSYQLR